MNVTSLVLIGLLLCRLGFCGAVFTEPLWKECRTPLLPLFICLQFVQGRPGFDKPSVDCCNAMSLLVGTRQKCVCMLIRDGGFQYFNETITYNKTLALQLPSLCHVDLNFSNCIHLLNLSLHSPDAKMFNGFVKCNANLCTSRPSPDAVANNCSRSWRCHKPTQVALIGGLALAACLLSIFAGFLLYKKHEASFKAQASLIKERELMLSSNSGGRSTKLFSEKEMKKATDCFNKHFLLGSGGFGDVYKGFLGDGTPVAVKVAKANCTKSRTLVLNEVSILSQVNHRNRVHLLGCCIELDQPMLVYEFVPNGTLHDHIHTSRYSFLDWNQRLRIARQTAVVLAYLHSSAMPPIYHRDIKSSNILLDERLNAKLSDFGLSRLLNSSSTHVSTCVQGTLGYLDPEYYRSYQLTDKSDVYSFGVVLLELVTSQRVLDYNRSEGDAHLVLYVQHKICEGELLDTLDRNLTSGASPEIMETMKALCLLAIKCVEGKTKDRPSMINVVDEIESISRLQSG